MSLQQFVARRKGFKKGLRIGEVIEYEGKKFVVIQILNTKINNWGTPFVQAEFIGQEVSQKTDYSKYKDCFAFKERYNIAKGEREILRVGDTMTGSEREKPIIKVVGIEKFEYEFTDLIVTYQAELIQPWDQREMDSAVKQNRLSTFKVISAT